MSKRALDVLSASLGLLFLAPLLLLIGALVRLGSGKPVLFRQHRIGRHGRPFTILKFRTMRPASETSLQLTVLGDDRVTRVGRWLRSTKLDELPQLINVLRGEMSLVGPRPEVPRYVDEYSPEQRRVLLLVPGITDPASIQFWNESEILAGAPDPERFYIDVVMPKKISINLEYAARATLASDIRQITESVGAVLRRVGASRPRGGIRHGRSA